MTMNPGIAYGGGQHLQALTIGDFLVVWKVNKSATESG